MQQGAPWVLPGWVEASIGQEVEVAVGSAGRAEGKLAGKCVRVVVTEGAEGRTLVDDKSVVADSRGVVR